MSRFVRAAAVAIVALGAAAAQAELPPKHQRAAELRAVLEHPGVVNAFPDQGVIDRIEYVRVDLYRVHSGQCHVDAAIIGLPMPSGVVGGRRFEVRPVHLVCVSRVNAR